MRIVIAADILGDKNNGTSIATYNLIDYLKSKGHDVRVICGDKDKINLPNFYIMQLHNFGVFNKYVKDNGVSLAKSDPQIILSALEGADVVHIAVPFSIGAMTARIANELNIPITASFHIQAENVTSHLYMMHSKFAHNTVYEEFWRYTYKYVDCIHFPTKFINSDFEKTVGPTNAYVISNGVKSAYHLMDVEKPAIYRDKFVILYTGRYSREKMHKTLIKAMKYSKYEKRIQLIFAGDGPLRPKIEKMTSNLTNKPILGLHDSSELVKIINYADLYVHCAYAELESIACLEAIKCGLVPVINNSPKSATRFFALDSNCIYRKNSSKSLAEKIDYWIEHESERKDLHSKYVEYASHFDFDRCMARMEKMMYEAIDIRKYKIEHNIHHRIVTYVDPLNDDFAPTDDISLNRIKIADDFKYVHKNIFWRFCAFILYNIIAKPILSFTCYIKRGVKVKNKKVLKQLKKQGYFLYGNHTTIFDGMIPQTRVATTRRVYMVANPDAVSIYGVQNIVMMLGCLPLPNTLRSSKNFLDAIKYRIQQKSVIAIYPEAHIWPFATTIRPFKETSFIYPAKLNVPVVAMVTTYRAPKGKINKKIRRPFIDITLSDPIYPNEGLSTKDNAQYMRDQVYNFMVKIASNPDNKAYITYLQAAENTAKTDNYVEEK